jgi:sulfate adenylyltransferase subunit 1 (EFTu-like GTPase family)
MGITKIIVVINKMDRVDYNEARFNEIIDGLRGAIERLKIETIYFVPISALAGDNVSRSSENMSWYHGPTLLERIQEWEFTRIDESKPRLNVQMISRSEDFRGLAGTVVGGSFSVGDEVIILPSKTQAKIGQIATFGGDINTAEDGMAVTLVLKPMLTQLGVM